MSESAPRRGRGWSRREWLAAAAGLSGSAAWGARPLPFLRHRQETRLDVDLCILAATAGGVAAAVQARRLGLSVVLLEPGRHVGGLTSGGLGATDAGRRGAIGGLARSFYDQVLAHYVSTYGADTAPVKACSGGFHFEPHVAEAIFRRWLDEAGVRALGGEGLAQVECQGRRITRLVTTRGRTIRAAIYVDASYEGDLLAAAGVRYAVGREANAVYGETLNGVQYGHPHHNFRVPVDPYVREGDASSGLLPGVSAEPLAANGTGDRKVQAYNFRMCLTRAADRLPFPRPDAYDANRYTLLARYLNAGVFDCLRLSTTMPNGKTDTNNYGGFSTDHIGANWDYPEGDAATRRRIWLDHLTYQQGLMWFLSHDDRVPAEVRDQVNALGLPRDEFTDSDGWPHQLYVREARRMVADLVMTEHHCRSTAVAADAVGLASYNMDSHHVQRVVVDGHARNEGDVEIGVPRPYPVGYDALVPREAECENLLVPVCLSSSHIAYGSIRMEPVFMVLGQSAATAAWLAIRDRQAVQQIDRAQLRERLLADGQILEYTAPVVTETRAAERIDPRSLPGLVLDDADGRREGLWIDSTVAGNRRVGTGYVHDGDTNKGQVSLTYTPELPAAGRYRVVLISVPNPNRSAAVPVTIAIDGAVVWQGTVDQREASHNGFAPLTTVEAPAGRRLTVRVSNAGTTGHVVADGLQLLPAAR